VRNALPVDENDIRLCWEFPDRCDDGMAFPEGEKTGDVGESQLFHGARFFHQGEFGITVEACRSIYKVFREGSVHTCHISRFPREGNDPHPLPQLLLEFPRLFDRDCFRPFHANITPAFRYNYTMLCLLSSFL
jgi:hypothetical protein